MPQKMGLFQSLPCTDPQTFPPAAEVEFPDLERLKGCSLQWCRKLIHIGVDAIYTKMLGFGRDWTREPFQVPGRNDPCLCLSGKKAKKCCFK